MGRRRVEIKRIEDKNSRQVTFSKRRNGVFKKAREISTLCDVDVALLVFSSRGRQYEYCSFSSSSSSSNSFLTMAERYNNYVEEEKAKNCECSCMKTITELMQLVQRSVDECRVDQLSLNEVLQLEKELDTALALTKHRKTQLMVQSISTLRETERKLREEKEGLHKEIATMGVEIENVEWDARQQLEATRRTLDLLL